MLFSAIIRDPLTSILSPCGGERRIHRLALPTGSCAVIPNEELLTKVWGPEFINDLQYLRVWVSKLRSKIEETPQRPKYLRTLQGIGYLLDPTGSIIPGNRSVRATTRDGRTIRGRRLNEDAYTIQLIDEQAHLVSLMKTDLRSLDLIPTSSMPSYETTLTADERADVIAYLLSLKGR